MSNKLPRATSHQQLPDMQSAAMQHQLHLNTLDIVSKLYSTALTDTDHTVVDTVRKAIVNLLEPFQPSLPSAVYAASTPTPQVITDATL